MSNVDDAVAALRKGRIIIVVDDEDRENEGDLVMAAEHATPEAIAFFLQHTSGLICVPVTNKRADELQLPMMVDNNTALLKTAFTVTVDATEGTTTGISARERANTIRMLADSTTKSSDLARPGHVHVLRADDGGVLSRSGHTEATIDLLKLARLEPVGVICEVVTRDKLDMARLPELLQLAEDHDLPMVSIRELVEYRSRLARGSTTVLPTELGDFRCTSFTSAADDVTHAVLTLGRVDTAEPTLVRIHSECLTGDVLGSMRCDCGEQLAASMKMIAAAGSGVLVYMRGHEGRGIGLAHKIDAYRLQDEGLDTVDANVALELPVDAREYEVAAQIIESLGVSEVRLITNNPSKSNALDGRGFEVVENVPLIIEPNEHNITYLETKRTRMGHTMGVIDADNI